MNHRKLKIVIPMVLLVLGASILGYTALNRAVEGFMERFTGSAPTMAEQKALADKALNETSSDETRSRIGYVWAYVDRLLDQADTTEALAYVARALPHDSLRLEYQMLYAERLFASGDRASGVERAELVAAHSEQDVLINRAHRVLGLEPIAPNRNPRSRSQPRVTHWSSCLSARSTTGCSGNWPTDCSRHWRSGYLRSKQTS